MFQGLSEGFALQEILLDPEGQPVDSLFLDVKAAFEGLTGFPKPQVAGAAASP